MVLDSPGGIAPSSNVFCPRLTSAACWVVVFMPDEPGTATTTPVAGALPRLVISIGTLLEAPDATPPWDDASMMALPVTLNGMLRSEVLGAPASMVLEYSALSEAVYSFTEALLDTSTWKNSVKVSPAETMLLCVATA